MTWSSPATGYVHRASGPRPARDIIGASPGAFTCRSGGELVDHPPQRRGVSGMRPTAAADHACAEVKPFSSMDRIAFAGDALVRTPSQRRRQRGRHWRIRRSAAPSAGAARASAAVMTAGAAQLTKIAAGPSGRHRGHGLGKRLATEQSRRFVAAGWGTDKPDRAGKPVSTAARRAMAASAAVGIVSTMMKSTPAAFRLRACARCSARATSGAVVSNMGR